MIWLHPALHDFDMIDSDSQILQFALNLNKKILEVGREPNRSAPVVSILTDDHDLSRRVAESALSRPCVTKVHD